MTPQINTIRRILAHVIIALLGLAIALNAAPFIAFAALSGMGFILAGINPADTAAALLFGCAAVIKLPIMRKITMEEMAILRTAAGILDRGDAAAQPEWGWNRENVRGAIMTLYGVADRQDDGKSFTIHAGHDAARQRIRQGGQYFNIAEAEKLIEDTRAQRDAAHKDAPEWWNAYIAEVQRWIDKNKPAAA